MFKSYTSDMCTFVSLTNLYKYISSGLETRWSLLLVQPLVKEKFKSLTKYLGETWWEPVVAWQLAVLSAVFGQVCSCQK